MRLTSDQRYSNVAVFLHWAIAACILFNLASGWIMEGLPKGELKHIVVSLHASSGLSVLVLTLVRIGWRLTHRPPALDTSLTRGERLAASGVHGLLYFLMIAMPMVGWAISSASTRKVAGAALFLLVPLPKLWFMNNLPLAEKVTAHDQAVTLHWAGAWVLTALLVAHVAGALKHQFLDRKPLLALAALTVSSGALAQTVPAGDGYQPVAGPHTLNPGDWPMHYPYADETEAAVAASEVHHVRYIDSHIRLVEVAYFPGVKGNMHGHPFPSVFAIDAPVPKSSNTPLDREHNMVSVLSQPIDGKTWPICRAAGPQNPHHETNQDSFPHHFYRLEFLRIDGAGLKDNWKDWYRTTVTGPDRSRLLYEDDHIRLVEVLIRPGETRRSAASKYPAVLAIDAADTPLAKDARVSPPLPGFDTLKCATTGASAAGVVRNTGTAPIHYYRLEFKRIDGDGIKDHWREWYPWMAELKDAYDRSPNTPNF
jgi:cytochrome b561